MPLKASVFIASSLDGYIARTDGSLDWLDEANKTVPESEDCGYREFIADIDILIMGRNTYEKVLSLGQWPYEKHVIVLSRKNLKIPQALQEKISHSCEPVEVLYERLRKEGIKHLYIDGGLTIQRFLAAGLIDDLIITTIPILLGKGKPLFGTIDKSIKLKHLQTKSYKFGFVQSHYQLIKN